MSISELTKRKIFDFYQLAQCHWSGSLNEPAFLYRLYKLDEIKSTDSRFNDAERDIWQHRENNDDWENDWILTDSRFGLNSESDELFLKFLCETIHPVVRTDEGDVKRIFEAYNNYLKFDGWEIYENNSMSGHPIFSYRKILLNNSQSIKNTKIISEKIDTNYVQTQIKRIEKSIVDDPELAIGASKEFLETVCKTILLEKGIELTNPKLPALVRETLKQLKLLPNDIPNEVKASETIKRLLMNLASISNSLAELRNPYGSGHGKEANYIGLEPRHARLAAGSAITLAVFIFETHQKRNI
ncbi:MAG: abortive infection family protein [Chloroflexi bacterium]|jgi:hypothetical protein|nr:abortive infection family protein [Chloroflexota bacterium]MBT3670089.1 abortive infection family protein [Chloroflexota bacterium]MBT4002301.1 abortive infection family protein [Chloroflexota bacterium]MBT4306709.1 abortive infection family protein [Chloroflexota bacterium]MBT4532975.1 abortive infection family protein [Chloroflexota bacterium]